MNQPIHLDSFLSTLFDQSALKSTKSKSSLRSLCDITIARGIDQFYDFYKNLPESAQKQVQFNSDLKKKLLSQIITDNKVDEKSAFFIKKFNSLIELRDLVKLKKNAKLVSGEDILDSIIEELSPKTARVNAIYELMNEYKAHFEKSQSIPQERLKEFSEKISPKLIEREVKTKKVSRSRYGWYGRKFGFQSKKSGPAPVYKSKVKTEEQKQFEQVFSIFLSFLGKHISEDFMVVLGIFEQDFNSIVKKLSSFKGDVCFDLWKNFLDKLDIKSYYDALSESKQEDFIASLTKLLNTNIKNNIVQKKFASTYQRNKAVRDSQIEPLKFKATVDAANTLVDFLLAMKKIGFNIQEVSQTFDIFDSSLAKALDTDKKGLALFSFSNQQIKRMGKEKTEQLGQLVAEWEKQEFEQKIALTTDIKSTKKYKI